MLKCFLDADTASLYHQFQICSTGKMIRFIPFSMSFKKKNN